MVDFLDTFIGLFSVYLLLSLIVTAITQGIVNTDKINLKGHIINRIIANLVGEEFAGKIEVHPKFQELCGKTKPGKPARLPSYMDPAVFAEILIEELVGDGRKFSGITPAQLDQALRGADNNAGNNTSALPEATIARLREIWDRADFNIDSFKQGIIDWFDRVSERSYGWHKRKLNVWLMTVGFAVALFINADTIHIFQRLTNDDSLRQQFVTNAIDYTRQLESTGEDAADRDAEIDAMLSEICQANNGEDCDDVNARSQNVVKALMPDLLPVIGWDAMPACLLLRGPCFEPSLARQQIIAAGPSEHGMAFYRSWLLVAFGPLLVWLGTLLMKLVGWGLTAMATSLGAPFWFDLLQKIIQIRGKVVPGGHKPGQPPGKDGKDGKPVTRELAAKTALRAEEVAATEADSLSEFNADRFGFDPVNIYWSARLAATAYLPDADVDVFLAEYGADGELIDIPDTNTQCLVATTPKAAFISFRGTEKVAKDWFTDIDVKLMAPAWKTADIKTHSGFTEALDSIWASDILPWIKSRQLAEKGIPLWFSGHSLGGALAALAALRLDMENEAVAPGTPRPVIAALHTFGQPRVGDENCAAELDRRLANKYFRMINQRDIVPRVPFPKADILLAKVKQHIQDKEAAGDIPAGSQNPGGEADYHYAHGGRVIYFNDLGRAIVDPQFWYRKLDTLLVDLDAEQIKEALQQTVGDHSMTGYIERSRALFRLAEPEA